MQVTRRVPPIWLLDVPGLRAHGLHRLTARALRDIFENPFRIPSRKVPNSPNYTPAPGVRQHEEAKSMTEGDSTESHSTDTQNKISRSESIKSKLFHALTQLPVLVGKLAVMTLAILTVVAILFPMLIWFPIGRESLLWTYCAIVVITVLFTAYNHHSDFNNPELDSPPFLAKALREYNDAFAFVGLLTVLH
jgi:hypothetical protein